MTAFASVIRICLSLSVLLTTASCVNVKLRWAPSGGQVDLQDPSPKKNSVYVSVSDTTGDFTLDKEDLVERLQAKIEKAIEQKGYVIEPNPTAADFQLKLWFTYFDKRPPFGEGWDWYYNNYWQDARRRGDVYTIVLSLVLAERVPEGLVQTQSWKEVDTITEGNSMPGIGTATDTSSQISWLRERKSFYAVYGRRCLATAETSIANAMAGPLEKAFKDNVARECVEQLGKAVPGFLVRLGGASRR